MKMQSNLHIAEVPCYAMVRYQNDWPFVWSLKVETIYSLVRLTLV